MEKLLGCMIVFVLIITIALIGLVAYVAIDEVGIEPTEKTTSIITAKTVKPPSTTTTWIMTGKVLIPITVTHPESYHVSFLIKETEVCCSINKPLFDQLAIGAEIEVIYGYGRLTKKFQPVSIFLKSAEKALP